MHESGSGKLYEIAFQWILFQFVPQGGTSHSCIVNIYMECVNTVCLGFSYEFIEFSQSLDFPSLACLHMPSGASTHAQ